MSYHRSGRRKPSKRHTILGFFNIVVWIVASILASLLTFAIYTYNLLHFNYFNIIVVALMGMLLLLTLVAILLKKAKVLTAFLLVLFMILSLGSLYFIKSFIDVSNRMNATASFSEVEMSIVVPADSSISTVDELEQVLAPVSMDKVNIEQLLTNIQEQEGHSLSVSEEASYSSSYDKLTSGEGKAMVLNSAYEPLLETSYSSFSQSLKKIYSFKVTKAISTSQSATRSDSNIMTIYISGIDTYGPISSVSRSDVNILMTINRYTNQILLTTTPRDSYVPIAGGGQNQQDKLTHSGIYGVESSIETLEQLYDVPIDYYARINFTSFINLIDLLGGVDVYNDQEFTSRHGNYHFPVGNVHLNSEQALGFVRERYSLEHGDNDRGKNQMKVIEAIINKMTSVKAVANYHQIADGIGESIQTNMPLVVMMDFANQQLASGRHYTITSQSLEGVGSTGELSSYAMPGSSLYMFSINQESLASAKEAIKAIMEAR